MYHKKIARQQQQQDALLSIILEKRFWVGYYWPRIVGIFLFIGLFNTHM